MYFFYSGKAPLDVLVPGEQYAMTVTPSDRSQRTTNEKFYSYIVSDEFESKDLFQHTDSFEPPLSKKTVVAPPPAKKAEEPKPAEGGTD